MSVVSEAEIEDQCVPKPIYSTMDVSVDEQGVAEAYDYSNVPESQIPWLRRILTMFAHCFTRKDSDRKVLRDTRLKLKLNLKHEPTRSNFYRADDTTAQLINEALMQNVRDGVAKVEPNPTFFSPTYLRLRASADFDALRVARAAGRECRVRYRLVGNFRSLNSALLNQGSHLPHLRETVSRGGGKPYLGCLDVSKCYNSVALCPSSHKYVTVASPTRLTVTWLVVPEGISNAVDVCSRIVSDLFLFADPPREELRLNLDAFKHEQIQGIKRDITDLNSLERALQRPDRGDLPPSRSLPHVRAEDILPEMLNNETLKLRTHLCARTRQAPVLLREQFHPNMLPTECCIVTYIDDGLLFALTISEFRLAIIAALIDISNANLILSPAKFQPFSTYNGEGKTRFLGFQIEGGTFRPIPERVDSIRSLREPTNLRSLRSILGSLNFFSPHIAEFATHSMPLYAALARARSNKTLHLTDKERQAFETLKTLASDPAKLYLPNENEVLFVEADASRDVASCIIYCHTTQGERRIVGYQSRIFSVSVRQSNSAIQKEIISLCLAMHFARFLVYKHEIRVVTDAKSIIALIISGRVAANARLELYLSRLLMYPVHFFIFVPDSHSRVDSLTRQSVTRAETTEYFIPGGIKTLQKSDINSPLTPGRIYTLREIERECLKNPQEVIPALTPVPAVGTSGSKKCSNKGSRQEDAGGRSEQNVLNEGIYAEKWDVPEEEDIQQYTSALVSEAVKLAPVIRQGTNRREHETVTMPTGAIHAYEVPPGICHHEVLHDRVNIVSSNQRSLYNPLRDVTLEHVCQIQAGDKNLSAIIKQLQTSTTKPEHLRNYDIRSGSLLVKQSDKNGERVVINEQLATRLVATLHSTTHMAPKKLSKVLSRYFAGKNILGVAKTICAACRFCAMRKRNCSYDMPESRYFQPSSTWQAVGADHILLGTPIYSRGRKYTAILTILDIYSSFCVARLVPSTDAAAIITVLNELKAIFVFADTTIVTDNGSGFTSRSFEKYCLEHGINHNLGIPYHSQSNSPVENMNAHVRTMLSIMMRSTKATAEVALTLALNAINSTPRSKARHSAFSPYEIMFNRSPTDYTKDLKSHIPDQVQRKKAEGEIDRVLTKVREEEEKIHQERIESYPRHVKLLPGTTVLLLNREGKRNKQDPLYLDCLFTIIRRQGHECVIQNVDNPAEERRCHARHLKMFDVATVAEDSLFRHLTASQAHNLGNFEEGGRDNSRWKRQAADEWTSLDSMSDSVSIDSRLGTQHEPTTQGDPPQPSEAKAATTEEVDAAAVEETSSQTDLDDQNWLTPNTHMSDLTPPDSPQELLPATTTAPLIPNTALPQVALTQKSPLDSTKLPETPIITKKCHNLIPPPIRIIITRPAKAKSTPTETEDITVTRLSDLVDVTARIPTPEKVVKKREKPAALSLRVQEIYDRQEGRAKGARRKTQSMPASSQDTDKRQTLSLKTPYRQHELNYRPSTSPAPHKTAKSVGLKLFGYMKPKKSKDRERSDLGTQSPIETRVGQNPLPHVYSPGTVGFQSPLTTSTPREQPNRFQFPPPPSTNSEYSWNEPPPSVDHQRPRRNQTRIDYAKLHAYGERRPK
jgi:hypothetical protein